MKKVLVLAAAVEAAAGWNFPDEYVNLTDCGRRGDATVRPVRAAVGTSAMRIR